MQFDDDKRHKAIIKAESLSDEFDTDEAEAFANKHKKAKWYDDFILLFEMITDKEFDISKVAYISIAGALAYAVLPTDIIPDFIPGIGFVDDVFVIGVVMKNISDEITRYKIYKNKKSNMH